MNIIADEELTVTMRNSLDQEISEKTYRVAAGETKLELDTRTLSAGVYFVTVSGKSSVQNMKLQKR